MNGLVPSLHHNNKFLLNTKTKDKVLNHSGCRTKAKFKDQVIDSIKSLVVNPYLTTKSNINLKSYLDVMTSLQACTR